MRKKLVNWLGRYQHQVPVTRWRKRSCNLYIIFNYKFEITNPPRKSVVINSPCVKRSLCSSWHLKLVNDEELWNHATDYIHTMSITMVSTWQPYDRSRGRWAWPPDGAIVGRCVRPVYLHSANKSNSHLHTFRPDRARWKIGYVTMKTHFQSHMMINLLSYQPQVRI